MDHMLEVLSTELSRAEADQLGKKLGISQDDIDYYLSQNRVSREGSYFKFVWEVVKKTKQSTRGVRSDGTGTSSS